MSWERKEGLYNLQPHVNDNADMEADKFHFEIHENKISSL